MKRSWRRRSLLQRELRGPIGGQRVHPATVGGTRRRSNATASMVSTALGWMLLQSLGGAALALTAEPLNQAAKSVEATAAVETVMANITPGEPPITTALTTTATAPDAVEAVTESSAAPDTAATETATPDTAAAETATPETTAPDTAASPEAAPQEAASTEASAQETAEPSTAQETAPAVDAATDNAAPVVDAAPDNAAPAVDSTTDDAATNNAPAEETPPGNTGEAAAVGEGESESISYSQLLKDIDNKKVKSVVYDPVQDVARVLYQDTPENEPLIVSLPNRVTELFDADRIAASGVIFEIDPTADNSDRLAFMLNLMLFLILIVAVMMIIRRSAGAANQAMNFGKSKARFQMEAKTGVMFEDVAGIEEAKEELGEVVSFLKQPEKFTAIGAKIPKGMLLVGPPGTGKTLLAKAIAGEAGVPFFSISGSEFVEMFVGVGASRVRDLFKKAKENRPCLIFIDEIDAVGRQRGAGIGGGNDEREQTLNQLLTEMDGFEDNAGIIIIAATNRPDVLDSALLRPGRFDRQVMVDLPTREGRLGILKVHARTKKMADDISLETISRITPGFSGADLANLLNEAAILTARRRKDAVTMLEVNDAIDRLTIGLTMNPLLDSKKKRLVAYHEVGHALLMTLLENTEPLDKVTIIPRSGGIGGFAKPIPDEENMQMRSRAQFLDDFVVYMGGRAAEMLVFGPDEVTPGAQSDIKGVTDMARKMVTLYGMSSLGQVALESSGGQVFVGGGLMSSRPEYSENMAVQIDRQVRAYAMQALEKACEILGEHRPVMDRLVDLLIEQEVLDGEDFRQVVAEYAVIPEKDSVKDRKSAVKTS